MDIPDPDNTGRYLATDVKQGASVKVSEALAKSLCEQADNWQKVADAPSANASKPQSKDGK